MQSKSYEAYRKEAKTGDIVLFKGRGLGSLVIRYGPKLLGEPVAQYSHVGMVVRTADDYLLILESTSLCKGLNGVQLHILSNRVTTYKGKVYIRKLNKHLSAPQHFRLNKLRKELSGIRYEKSKKDLIWAGMGLSRDDGTGLSSLFCSELVVHTFQKLSMVDDTKPPSSFAPDHLSYSNQKIEPINGYHWYREFQLDKPIP